MNFSRPLIKIQKTTRHKSVRRYLVRKSADYQLKEVRRRFAEGSSLAITGTLELPFTLYYNAIFTVAKTD